MCLANTWYKILEKMKYFTVLVLLFIACYGVKKSKLVAVQVDYKNLKDSILFIDNNANIFILQHINIMRQAGNVEYERRFFDLLAFDDTVCELKKIIDIKTFTKIGNTAYKDKNYYYNFYNNPNSFPNIICRKVK